MPDNGSGFAAMTNALTDNGAYGDGSDPIKSQVHRAPGSSCGHTSACHTSRLQDWGHRFQPQTRFSSAGGMSKGRSSLLVVLLEVDHL